MRLLTPSEKLFILENKALPKKEVERVAELLKAKFRFAAGRANGNLIPTYLEKVVVEKDGKVDRNQEYIRRIARILDNANTELVAAAIEYALANKGVYEFKIPSGLMDKAKELAAQIVDNGFSFQEFVEWLGATKAYKNDADEIMADGKIKDLEALYTQLLGTANESSSLDGFIAVERPTDVEPFKAFDKLVDHLKEKYSAGPDYNVMADGSLTLNPEIVAVDTEIDDMLRGLGDLGVKVGDFGVNEANDDTKNYNLDAKVKHDWTTDLDNELKEGETVNIDIVEKSPGSTWNLISVRRKGKHLGYVETENVDSMFEIIGKSKYSPEYEPEANECKVGDTVIADGVEGKVTAIKDDGKIEVQKKGKTAWDGEIADFDPKDVQPVSEGRMQIKRAYKRNGVELKPAVTVAEEAVMRNKIVKFLGAQPLFRASKKSILEFFNALNEDAEVGRVPSAGWLYRNQHLVKKIKVGKDSFYKLTRAGLNLFNKVNKTVNEEVEEEVVVDESGAFSITDVLDVEEAKKAIAACPEGETCILIPHYSINVQSKYEDGEELQNDLDELEEQLGLPLIVNDYDDLVADPHGVLSDEVDERRRGEAHEDEVVDALVPYYTMIRDDKGFTNLQIGRGGKTFTFETAEEVPHHYEDGQTEIQKFEVGVDGDDIYCLFDNNGDEEVLTSPEDLKNYVGSTNTNEAMTEAELEATKDWFSTLGEEERDGFMDRYQDETGEKLDDKATEKIHKAFWKWLAGEQQVAMQEGKNGASYEIVVMGDADAKAELMAAIEQALPDNITIAGEDFGVIIHDDVDREIFDKAFGRLSDSSGLQVQAFQNDAPVDLKAHAEMIKESVDASEYFTVQQPTREQMVTYRALQMYLKRHFTNKEYNTTSSGTLRIKKAIQEKLTPYLKSLDVIQPEAAK